MRLRGECEGLRERGVRFLLSNADTPAVRELYADFKVTAVPARRAISRDGSGRGPVGELLVAG